MILREVGKPGNTLETIERGFKITREAGVRRGANVMVGLPRESWESVKKTSSFVKRLDPDAITVDVVTPYPGTVLYEMAKENNWLITEDWERYTTVDPVMTLTDFTSEDMLRARRYLLDQMRVKARTKAVTQAIRQKDLLSVIRESIRLISTLPPNWRRLLNLVRSRLK